MSEIEKPYVVVVRYGRPELRRIVKETPLTWSFEVFGLYGRTDWSRVTRENGSAPETRFATQAQAEAALARARAAEAAHKPAVEAAAATLREAIQASKDAVAAAIRGDADV